MIEVRFKKKDPSVVLPSYKTEGAAGADVRAYLPEVPCVLGPGSFMAVPTGLYPEIPAGYEIQVRPRSGLAFKNGVTVLNSPGTVDSDYRGEIMVILINHGKEDFVINNGDRIAQLVVAPAMQASFREVDAIDETDRGSKGFGSTGIK